MDLILNGERREFDALECANLAELVARAEGLEGAAEDSIVVSIAVDGEALSPDELDRLELRPISNVGRVELVRRPSREVAARVLAQGADYTAQVAAAIERVVVDYRAGRTERASGTLAEVLDSLSILTNISLSIAGALPEASRALVAEQAEIQPWLQEMLEAQSGLDPIRIADVLEYEIAPRIAGWGTSMRTHCTASARTTADR